MTAIHNIYFKNEQKEREKYIFNISKTKERKTEKKQIEIKPQAKSASGGIGFLALILMFQLNMPCRR